MARNVKRKDKIADSYDSRVVSVRRTTKVREGGRDFSFSVVVVLGDGKGKVGFGSGKAKEVVIAVQKATDAARKNLHKIPLKKETLQHAITTNCGATKVIMLPGAPGTGIKAGGAMRPVFEVLGIKNVIAKCYGSRNSLNVVRATIKGLVSMDTPAMVAERRGITVDKILGKKKNGSEKEKTA